MAVVRNVHERSLTHAAKDVGALLDSLASPTDRLWPAWRWPPQRFDRPLAVGASGGHGPIRYFVSAYVAGSRVVYEFTAPHGLVGTPGFDVVPRNVGISVLRHTLEGTTTGTMRVAWPLVWRPMHDALIEDALDTAAASLAATPIAKRRLSAWVRLLRALAWAWVERGHLTAVRSVLEQTSHRTRDGSETNES